ncbi:VOC family protein [Archangium violaceum]|uniref:VOC family protein n=1 Tax=Archangium violaceum TaxID=83451 RepID=UPI002B2B735C|nr:VOC family protein [Archangium violaceum]
MSRTTKGIPGALAVHHVAETVPNLDQAVNFFVNVLGAELLYRIGPVEDKTGDWMTRQLNVNPRASTHIAMLRFGPYTNLELFEYTAPGQRQQLPRNSDWGGHHLAIGVENVDAAVDYLRSVPGVKILGEAQTITEGPIAGDRWVYFLTPWGMQMEVLHMPKGMPYEQDTNARLFDPSEPWDSR